MKVIQLLNSKNKIQFVFNCPGCGRLHMIDGNVLWNEDFEYPTFSGTHLYPFPDLRRCHSVIKNGWITFLDDSHHEAACKTIRLNDV